MVRFFKRVSFPLIQELNLCSFHSFVNKANVFAQLAAAFGN